MNVSNYITCAKSIFGFSKAQEQWPLDSQMCSLTSARIDQSVWLAALDGCCRPESNASAKTFLDRCVARTMHVDLPMVVLTWAQSFGAS